MKNIVGYIKGKSFWRYSVVALFVAIWCCLMVFLCEGIAQGSFEAYEEFLAQKNAVLILGNVALVSTLLAISLSFLLRSFGAGIGLIGLLLYVAHTVNAFKLLFRGEPLFPWDLSLASEVGNIMADLEFEINPWMIWGAAILLIGILGGILFDTLLLKKYRCSYRRALAMGAAFVVAFLSCSFLLFSESYLAKIKFNLVNWDQVSTYRENGFVYSFIANASRARVEEPEGYSEDKIKEIAKSFEKEEVSVENPNVIIVMSEAFSDIWNASNLQFSKELAPNFTALSKKYLSGRLLTSQYGGGTANSEFEVLTSFSTLQLPTGTIAYMNYVNREVDSYVSFLDQRGYATVGLHPYIRNYFSRDKAYEFLGFDSYYSEEYFHNEERIRWAQYVSDRSFTERIIEEFETNQKIDAPFFCHAVSMQNHASFGANELPKEDQVEITYQGDISEEEKGPLQTYASLLTLTDQALGDLVEYFEQVDEPTVIIFFGDHQPAVSSESDFFQRIGYATGTEEEQIYMRYSTPYLIWNNFEETPTHAVADMSMFYLLPYMTKTLKTARPLYFDYMDTLYESFKGASYYMFLDNQAQPIKNLPTEAQEKLKEYQLLIYDGLIGKRYGSKLLY